MLHHHRLMNFTRKNFEDDVNEGIKIMNKFDLISREDSSCDMTDECPVTKNNKVMMKICEILCSTI